jgi:hypothetical protein
MGQRIFERAVSEAESLVDVADAPAIEDVFFEEFLYVPAQIYEEATGREIPEYTGQVRQAPVGEKWSEEGDGLKLKFPRLWKRYVEDRRRT